MLFDVDGTLIDSNYLQVHAWHRAFSEAKVDVEACKRAGVPSIAVLSGGVSCGELETAGAQAVFDDPRDLCNHLDSTAIGRLAEAVQTA